MKNVSDRFCRENKKKSLWSITFFYENRAAYEITWGKKYGTAGQVAGNNIKGRMHFACWVTKVTRMRLSEEIIRFHAPKNLRKSHEHFFWVTASFPCRDSNQVHLEYKIFITTVQNFFLYYCSVNNLEQLLCCFVFLFIDQSSFDLL